jgi:hypothetical protein
MPALVVVKERNHHPPTPQPPNPPEIIAMRACAIASICARTILQALLAQSQSKWLLLLKKLTPISLKFAQ